MTSKEAYRSRLQDLLRELFQFDAEELDFGIYRVLRQRRERIDRFIEEDLLEAIEEVVSQLSATRKQEAQEKVEEHRKTLIDAIGEDALTASNAVRSEYEDTPAAKRYMEAVEELEAASVAEEAEAQVYNDLHRFFSRFYDEGDFIAARRFASQETKYCVPYSGEEVLLHWATKNQYYIKSGAKFTRYEFELEGVRVHFRLVEADIPRENVKGDDRYFVLAEPPLEFDEANDVLTLQFQFRPITDDEENEIVAAYNAATGEDRSSFVHLSSSQRCRSLASQILAAIDDSTLRSRLGGGGNGKSPLQAHLERYTGGHTKDYFIHRDLGAFLRRELNFFLKSEVVDTHNLLDSHTASDAVTVVRARAIRAIAERVISFLAQLEDFQRRLWEKKKFVLETEYMVTIDRVPRDLWDKILANSAQITRWKELYRFEEWNEELPSFDEVNIELLESCPQLMVDTAFFSEEFKNRLISSFEDLEGAVDGILIQGDNWQALNLLQARYSGEVDCVYIDPPYNSPSTEILYKNNYKHSSWLSLMENRYTLTRKLLSDDGVLVTAIDDIEQERFGLLLETLFPEKRRTCVTVVHNPGGIQGDNFSYNHEYAYFVYPRSGRHIGLKDRTENPDVRPLRDVSKGDHLREAAANCFYPIYVKDGEIVGFGDVCDDSFHPDGANVQRDDGVIEVYPIDAQGNERKWVFARQSVEDIADELTAKYNNQREIWDIIREKTKFNHKTVWADKEYNSNTYGSRYLNNMFGEERFSFPKSIYNVHDCVSAATYGSPQATVVDYFAGSGTTGEAVQRLNRADGGRRKYVLIEMDDFFDEVLRPRMAKTSFSLSWKDGVPQNSDGISQVIKYQRIESYEDALDNVSLEPPEERDTQAVLEGFEDYMPVYFLELESRGSSTLLPESAFARPFELELQIRRGGMEPEMVGVDLPETFHYMVGARVRWRRRVEHQGREYLLTRCDVKEGSNLVPVLTVWRNSEGLDLEEEAEWVDSILTDVDVDRVIVSSESLIEGAEPVEVIFREQLEVSPYVS